MAFRVTKVCAHPGCGVLVSGTGNRCEKHERVKQAALATAKARYDETTRKMDPALREAAAIRSSSRWQMARSAYRSTHPLCCNPFGWHKGPEPMRHVHHVQGLAVRPDLALDWDNLRSLCWGCHNEVERRERRGEDTALLFAGLVEPDADAAIKSLA